MLRKAPIRDRIEELRSRNAEIAERSTARAIERAVAKIAISKERVLLEMARIGFADIRNAIEWHGDLVQETDNPDGGDVLVIKNLFTNHVKIKSSADLSPDIAAAISEMKLGPNGLSVKMHNKSAALDRLGQYFGLWKGETGDTTPRSLTTL